MRGIKFIVMTAVIGLAACSSERGFKAIRYKKVGNLKVAPQVQPLSRDEAEALFRLYARHPEAGASAGAVVTTRDPADPDQDLSSIAKDLINSGSKQCTAPFRGRVKTANLVADEQGNLKVTATVKLEITEFDGGAEDKKVFSSAEFSGKIDPVQFQAQEWVKLNFVQFIDGESSTAQSEPDISILNVRAAINLHSRQLEVTAASGDCMSKKSFSLETKVAPPKEDKVVPAPSLDPAAASVGTDGAGAGIPAVAPAAAVVPPAPPVIIDAGVVETAPPQVAPVPASKDPEESKSAQDTYGFTLDNPDGVCRADGSKPEEVLECREK